MGAGGSGAAAALDLGSPLRAVQNYDSYDCRGRNNVVGATISEHGKGNALDIRASSSLNGKSVDPTDPKVSQEFREG